MARALAQANQRCQKKDHGGGRQQEAQQAIYSQLLAVLAAVDGTSLKAEDVAADPASQLAVQVDCHGVLSSQSA